MIYMDNAATSYPKPQSVIKTINSCLSEGFFSPHSIHSKSLESAKIIHETREILSSMFSVKDPSRVIFTLNATHAINIALHGILSKGDYALTTAISHNSVMRPLHELKKTGVNSLVIECDEHGNIDMKEYERVLSTKKIKLAVLTHASNVNGIIHDIENLSDIAHKYGSLVLVDAAQTAGLLDINMSKFNIDLLALTGHKTLYGAQGIGALILNDNFDIGRMESYMQGGSGSKSESEEQPNFLPDKYEAGTLNGIGISSLHASLKWINENGKRNIVIHERKLRERFFDSLSSVPAIKMYGTKEHDNYVGIISLTVDCATVDEVGSFLDEKHGILTRVGLHCCPIMHKTMGTIKSGTVRFSFSIFTTEEEIDQTTEALKEYVKILRQNNP